MNVMLTDSPAVVDLKAQYRRLDALHEQVKFWPDDLSRTVELANLTLRKREIAAEIFQMEGRQGQMSPAGAAVLASA